MLQVLVNVSFEKFQLQKKRHGAMQKLFMKEKEKKKWKNGQMFKISKTMGTQMPAMKKKKKRDE